MTDSSRILTQLRPQELSLLIIDTFDDAIVSHTLDGTILTWNAAAHRLFGFSAEEMIGESILRLYPAERLYEHKNLIDTLSENRTLKHFETQRFNKDGNLIHVSLDISPIRDQNENVVGTTSFFRASSASTSFDKVLNQYKAIVESSDDAIISKTLSGIITSWNRGAEIIFGYTADEIVGESITRLYPRHRIGEEAEIISRISKGDRVDHFETVRVRKDGAEIHLSVSVSPLCVKGEIIGAATIARDITDRVESEKISNQFRAIVTYSQDAIITKDLNGMISSWNRAAEHIFGYAEQEMVGRHISTIIPKERLHEEEQIMARILAGERVAHFESVRKKKSGQLVDVSITLSPILVGGELIGASKVARDISSEIQTRKEVWVNANFDSLTDLPNRQRFIRILNQKINNAKFDKNQFAVLFIDLDNFKMVNDNYGHVIGDKVIQLAAARIRDALNQADFAARLGGDEFVIISHSYLHIDDIKTLCERIVANLNIQSIIEKNIVSTSASIGVSTFPEDGDNEDELIQKADHAMYVSKSMGRNQYHFFDKYAQQDSVTNTYALLCDLRAADLSKQIEIYFQPILNDKTRQIAKAEVLARWNHPLYGIVRPDVFIPLAEKHGLILAIGEVVTAKAVKALAEFVSLYGDDFQLSINKSPLQFHNINDDPASLIDALEAHKLTGKNICLEITEDSMMNASEVTRKKLAIYKKAGVSISLDDFGKGYSSLSYLKDFNVDFIKIDKDFVQHLQKNSVEYYLTEGVAKIADNLRIAIIAEGVETKDQQVMLAGMGINLIQGYLISKPKPLAEFKLFMAEWNAVN